MDIIEETDKNEGIKRPLENSVVMDDGEDIYEDPEVARTLEASYPSETFLWQVPDYDATGGPEFMNAPQCEVCGRLIRGRAVLRTLNYRCCSQKRHKNDTSCQEYLLASPDDFSGKELSKDAANWNLGSANMRRYMSVKEKLYLETTGQFSDSYKKKMGLLKGDERRSGMDQWMNATTEDEMHMAANEDERKHGEEDDYMNEEMGEAVGGAFESQDEEEGSEEGEESEEKDLKGEEKVEGEVVGEEVEEVGEEVEEVGEEVEEEEMEEVREDVDRKEADEMDEEVEERED